MPMPMLKKSMHMPVSRHMNNCVPLPVHMPTSSPWSLCLRLRLNYTYAISLCLCLRQWFFSGCTNQVIGQTILFNGHEIGMNSYFGLATKITSGLCWKSQRLCLRLRRRSLCLWPCLRLWLRECLRLCPSVCTIQCPSKSPSPSK